MAVKGIKVNNKELQKSVDKILDNQLKKAAKAGKQALEEVSDFSILQFYKMSKSSHWYSSIPHANKIRLGNYKQNNRFAWIDIETYVDEEEYRRITEPYYNIYDWADRHNKSQDWASRFVIDLQWNKGIIGLPSPYAHYTSSILREMMKDEIRRSWSKKTSRLLK